MGLIELVFLLGMVLVLPLLVFMSLICIGIIIWSWKRVGPYFVSFGRWVSDWRNVVPLGCLGVLAIVLTILVAMLLPAELSFVRYVLLGAVLLVVFIVAIVALGVWVVRLASWFWNGYRRGFWDMFERLYETLWTGMSGRRTGTQARRRGRGMQIRTGQAAAQSGEAPAATARPVTRSVVPTKRSGLDAFWLFALIWGRPRQAVRKPGPLAKSPEAQTQTTVVARESTTPPRVPTKQKAGLQPLLWRLGLLGRPRGVRGAKPGAPKGTAETPEKPVAPAPPMVSQPRPSVATPAAKPAEAKPKPPIVLRAKPKRGVLGAFGGVGRSIVGSLEALRKGFWVGVFWVMGKARAGVKGVLRLLHLGGKRK